MKKHEHAGKSSRLFLKPRKILGKIGISTGMTLLDAGCGEGQFSVEAARLAGSPGKIYALDIDESSIGKLKKELSEKGITNVIPMVADFSRKTGFGKGIFDVVLMVNVLHGFVVNGEADAVLKEVSRILNPGGRVAVVEFKKGAIFGPPKDHRISPEQVKGLFKGFRMLSLENVGLFSYMMVFEKS